MDSGPNLDFLSFKITRVLFHLSCGNNLHFDGRNQGLNLVPGQLIPAPPKKSDIQETAGQNNSDWLSPRGVGFLLPCLNISRCELTAFGSSGCLRWSRRRRIMIDEPSRKCRPSSTFTPNTRSSRNFSYYYDYVYILFHCFSIDRHFSLVP